MKNTKQLCKAWRLFVGSAKYGILTYFECSPLLGN